MIWRVAPPSTLGGSTTSSSIGLERTRGSTTGAPRSSARPGRPRRRRVAQADEVGSTIAAVVDHRRRARVGPTGVRVFTDRPPCRRAATARRSHARRALSQEMRSGDGLRRRQRRVDHRHLPSGRRPPPPGVRGQRPTGRPVGASPGQARAHRRARHLPSRRHSVRRRVGPEGLAAYRRVVEPKWAALGPGGPQWSGEEYRIREAMAGVALASGDPDELIRVKRARTAPARDYEEVARVLCSAGRADEALEWALRRDRRARAAGGTGPRPAKISASAPTSATPPARRARTAPSRPDGCSERHGERDEETSPTGRHGCP